MAVRSVLIHIFLMLRAPTPETLSTLGMLLALAPLLAAQGRRRFSADWLCDGYRTQRKPR